MLYHVLGTFSTFLVILVISFGGGPPKYLNLATCYVSFFFFLKPSDRISLPFLAQIDFCGGGCRAGRGLGGQAEVRLQTSVPDLTCAYCFSGQVCTVCSAVYMAELRL